MENSQRGKGGVHPLTRSREGPVRVRNGKTGFYDCAKDEVHGGPRTKPDVRRIGPSTVLPLPWPKAQDSVEEEVTQGN